MNRLSLFFKFLTFFSFFTLLLISFFTVYAAREMKNILTTQVHSDLTAIAEGTEGQIFMFFENQKSLVVNWSSDSMIRNEFEMIVTDATSSTSIESLATYIDNHKRQTNQDILITDIFDMNGIVRVSTERERIGHTESPAEMNLEYALDRAKQAQFGKAFFSAPVGESGEPGHIIDEPLWHTSTPLISEKTGETIGVMVNHITGNTINNIVSGKWQLEQGALSGQKFILEQDTAEMFIVNRQGLMITPSRFIESSIFHQVIDNPATRACFQEKQEYSGSYVGYLGRSVEVASMCFVDYNIVLLSEIASDELFAPITEEVKHFILVGIAFFITSVMFIFLIVRIILRGVHGIRKTANEVNKGNFATRAPIVSHDEIGELAKTFNQMLDAIEKTNTELKSAETQLKGVNLSLENRVKERTTELESLKTNLEKTVLERTVELQKKLEELEKFKKLTVGREIKMVELKQEIEQLKNSHQ